VYIIDPNKIVVDDIIRDEFGNSRHRDSNKFLKHGPRSIYLSVNCNLVDHICLFQIQEFMPTLSFNPTPRSHFFNCYLLRFVIAFLSTRTSLVG